MSCTNELRASVGRSTLSRSNALYAAGAAEHDGRNHTPHRYFDQTRGGSRTLHECKSATKSVRSRGAPVVQEALLIEFRPALAVTPVPRVMSLALPMQALSFLEWRPSTTSLGGPDWLCGAVTTVVRGGAPQHRHFFSHGCCDPSSRVGTRGV